ncbi:hypothetical protein ACFQVD_09195 [Streptosporangium amethystogenes subsp. fukuiense]|uniref:Uncharacterized protein n=1 Tax=Streptosporangium amethystogenes subsp. fukuiense TaxID=698418 RepID=A0ABW2SWN8_9ACTN
MTTDTVTLRPVGRVVGGRSEMVEDDWHDVRAVIRLDGETFTQAEHPRPSTSASSNGELLI